MIENNGKRRGLEGGLDKLFGLGDYADLRDGNKKTKRSYKNYSEEEKKSALIYLLIDNKTVREVTNLLDVDAGTLYRWKSEKEKKLLELSKISNEELNAVHKENQLLKEEKAVLLKAHAIFTKSLSV